MFYYTNDNVVFLLQKDGIFFQKTPLYCKTGAKVAKNSHKTKDLPLFFFQERTNRCPKVMFIAINLAD